ncbi:hypothetical protein BC833DRAFT_594348 [Globomyces pollinis-pini]|nr:hypothetical protein BC833DRAFT_594348 [Globomyces pollinis-pini]
MVTESSLDKDAQQLIEQLESIKLNQVDLQMDMDGRSYLLQFIPETRHSLNYLTGNSFILISKLNSELLQTIVPTVCIGSKHPNVSLMDLEHYIISNEEYINLTEHLIPMELKDVLYICSLVSIGEFKLDIPIFCYHQDRNGIANTILGVRKHQSHTELIHCNEIDEKYTQIPDLQILKAKLNYELPFDLMAMQNSIQVSRYDILSPLGVINQILS